MEIIQETKAHRLSFEGSGRELFGIVIVNWFLTAITLGFYYPWAKAKQLQYLYGATALDDDRFAFHGTGEEMFKGFIKTVLIFGGIYGLFYLMLYFEYIWTGLIALYAGILLITPLAIHGSYRYRLSRTSWRGIRFGYRGVKTEFVWKFFLWVLLTILTVGFYGAWMIMNMRNYIIGHIRMGSMEFKYKGDGLTYLLINLKGYLLTILTLGIYFFWWQRDLYAYYIDNLSAEYNGKTARFRSNLSAGDVFGLTCVNIMIIIFTLGFGFPWVVARTMKLTFSRISIESEIDLEEIAQTEGNYQDATGEDMSDMLDMDFVI